MNIFTRKGFSIIEIMIVVAIIAIAASIAIPNFLRMSSISKKTVCIEDLRKIDAAINQWAIDRGVASGANITKEQEEYIYANYFHVGRPACPAGGEYVLNSVGSNPQVQCTIEDEGHKL